MQMRTLVTAAFLLFTTPLFAHPPVSVIVDSRGNVYYSDLEQVWRIAPDGTKRVAVPNVHTHELYLDAQDNLYGEHLWYEGDVTKKWGHYVWRRDPAGRVAKVIPNTEGFRRNYSFVRDRAGNMYFADLEGKTVTKRTPAGKNEILARGFRDIRWMSALPDGTLDFTDAGDVVRITPDKRLTRIARGLAHDTLLRPHASGRHAVQGIWHDRAGTIYLADSAHGQVKRVTNDGKVSVVAESIPPWTPSGGTFAPNGDLLVLEYSVTNQVRVRRVRLH
jgi:sugar lactone lactonase YvrE